MVAESAKHTSWAEMIKVVEKPDVPSPPSKVTVSNKPLVWLRGVTSFPAPLIEALIDASTTSVHDEHSSSTGGYKSEVLALAG